MSTLSGDGSKGGKRVASPTPSTTTASASPPQDRPRKTLRVDAQASNAAKKPPHLSRPAGWSSCSDGCSVWVDPEWFQMGPFPAGMREGPFGPDIFAAAKSNSAYTTQAPCLTWIPKDRVDVRSPAEHTVTVAFDDIDWESARQTAGSSALQWQALAATRLHVGGDAEPVPVVGHKVDALLSPRSDSGREAPFCEDNILQAVSQVTISFQISHAEAFTLIGQDQWSDAVAGKMCLEWYLGDMYDYQARRKPTVSHTLPVPEGKYILLVRPSFEVRILGLPPSGVRPTVQMEVLVHCRDTDGEDLELEDISLVEHPPFCAYPSVLVGKLASDYIAFAIRNDHPTATLKVEEIYEDTEDAEAPLFATIDCDPIHFENVIPPCSTRKVTFKVSGAHSIIQPERKSVEFMVRLASSAVTNSYVYRLLVPLEHVDFRGDSSDSSYVYTYLSAGGAQSAIIQPPRELGDSGALNVLALHGAGVDATSAFWRTALPRQERGWVLMPTGLTSWGLDWTMASKQAYEDLLKSEYYLPLTTRAPGNKVFVIGHSNGGQGALYALTHDPDRFAGGFIAAGYVNMQEYVSNSWQASRNLLDPVLQGILQSSLSVFHNDLFASHLVGKPITIKYGSCDDNVPRWHSRLLASLISQWSLKTGEASEYPRLIEVPDKGHWWDGVLSSEDVCEAIRDADKSAIRKVKHFVVATVVPSETGPVHGVQILETAIPGRLARIEVRTEGGVVSMDTVNVSKMLIKDPTLGHLPQGKLVVDGTRCTRDGDLGNAVHIARNGPQWMVYVKGLNSPRLLCPISLFLSAPSRIFVVLPKLRAQRRRKAYESVAKRWALDVLLYITLNVYIVEEDELNESMCGPQDYHVFMGASFENASSSQSFMRPIGGICVSKVTGTQGISASITIRSKTFSGAGIGLLYSVPHPRHPYVGKALVLTGTDEEGIERAGRLLPVRTGVPIPEWIVVGQDADRFGAGGVLSAGWYDNAWDWSPEMSYV